MCPPGEPAVRQNRGIHRGSGRTDPAGRVPKERTRPWRSGSRRAGRVGATASAGDRRCDRGVPRGRRGGAPRTPRGRESHPEPSDRPDPMSVPSCGASRHPDHQVVPRRHPGPSGGAVAQRGTRDTAPGASTIRDPLPHGRVRSSALRPAQHQSLHLRPELRRLRQRPTSSLSAHPDIPSPHHTHACHPGGNPLGLVHSHSHGASTAGGSPTRGCACPSEVHKRKVMSTRGKGALRVGHTLTKERIA